MKHPITAPRIIPLLLVLLLLVSLLPTTAFAEEPAPDNSGEGYIVRLRDTAGLSMLSESEHGLEVISPQSNLYFAQSMEQISECIPESQIDYIEPNYKLQLLDAAVNDTLYTSGAQWNLDTLHVPAAWEKGQYGSGVTVAVIDSGLYGIGDGEHHEDIDPAKVVKPHNFLDDNANVTDRQGHGTFVAGVLFANTNNNAGVAGVMPEIKIMPLKVFGTDDAETVDVIEAIAYAVENGADVINLSLGGTEYSKALEDACNAAVAAGTLVVAAAGNDGTSALRYPAAYDSVIGVAALTRSNVPYENSQYGKSVYVAAPGEGLVGISAASNQYCYKTGTSVAAPEVSALAAMAKSISPSINQDGFKQLIQQTSTDLGEAGFDIYYGYGLINFEAAANKLLGTETETHHYGAWVANGSSTHTRVCRDDGCTARETALHIWGAGVSSTDGITYTCTACGYELVSVNPISNEWEYQLIDGGSAVKLTRYCGTQTRVIVPSELEIDGQKLPVTTIGNQTFLESDIFQLELPDSITTVEDGYNSMGGIVGACAFCRNLTIVKLPASLAKIADYMFYGAGSSYRLELTIPNGVKEIGISAFSLCNSLTELTLPASVTKIDNSAFYQARRLAKLNMPGVTTIEADAFTETIFEETYEDLWKAGEFTGIVYAGKVAYLYFGPYIGDGSADYAPSVMPAGTEITLEDGTLGISEFLFSSHYVDAKSCKANLKSITVPQTLQFMPNDLLRGYESVDMYGFAGSYAQTYAEAYENVHFHAFQTPAEPVYDYDWYDNASSDIYVIRTAADLWGLADLMDIGEDSFAGKTIQLANDMDLGGLTASGYGVKANQWYGLDGFQGTFDGQGHTISGVYVNASASDYMGFFTQLSGTAAVKNLTVEGKITGRDYVGGIVGKNVGGTIENCTFRGIVTGGDQYGYIGGIAGYASGTITGCKTYGSVSCTLSVINDTLLTGAVGGIVGYTGISTIQNCDNHAAVTGNAFSIGGIAGQAIMKAAVTDCTNNGTVTGPQFVGGIVGRVTASGLKIITGCVNNGSIRGVTYVGGIAGAFAGHMTSAEKCRNTGSVAATNYAAGILGYSEAGKIVQCANTGRITAKSHAAGIIAKDSGFGVWDSYNTGDIAATSSLAGGIIAFANNANDEGNMINCYNTGAVTAPSQAAPLGNVYSDGDIFENCYYLADAEDASVENQTAKTADAFASGEVAYRLGDSFGQLIGTDPTPVFRTDSNTVFTNGSAYYNVGNEPGHTHNFGDWTVTKEAACTEAGTETRTCACGETESREIPALGHTWDEGKVTTAPTYDADGVMTYTCIVCGETRTESIPKLVKLSRPFADVKEGEWFYDDVYVCFDMGLLVGVSETEFLPNGAMTRAMLATVLYRMAGSPEVSYQDVFTDVADGNWYSDAIVWASAAGVVCGYPDGTFQPMTSITREEMVSMLYRFAKLSDPELGEITPDLSAFRDGSDAYDYAVVPLSWAAQTGLIVGMSNNVLAPKGTATRAQAAALLVRYCAEIAK